MVLRLCWIHCEALRFQKVDTQKDHKEGWHLDDSEVDTIQARRAMVGNLVQEVKTCILERGFQMVSTLQTYSFGVPSLLTV